MIHGIEVANHEAETLPLSANSATERAAALRHVLKATVTRAEEDEALWMLGLHYLPEPPHARRHPFYSNKIIPAEVVPDGE